MRKYLIYCMILMSYSHIVIANPVKYITNSQIYHQYLSLVAEAKTRVAEVTPAEVNQLVKQNKQPYYLIDIRDDKEWAKNHIPSAIHISRGVLEYTIESYVPDLNSYIILYCAIGNRSVLAADMLQKLGYKHVASMSGGIEAWLKHGYAVK